MHRIFVSSSAIVSVGYRSPNILEIEFPSRAVYRYYGVPQGVYDGLMNAGSHGTYFNDYIKGHFSDEMVREPDPPIETWPPKQKKPRRPRRR
jgi:hypothetical protein